VIYENPKIPEGINSGTRRPLRDLFVLGTGALLLAGSLLFTLVTVGSTLAPHIPFSWERYMAETLPGPLVFVETSRSPQLQAMVDALAEEASLSESMVLTAEVMETDDVNAYATLGGHIVVTRGMLDSLPSENALAWVLSHEIAHVANRDVMRSLGADAFFALGAALLLGNADALGTLVAGGGHLTRFHFSRKRERAADKDGLAILAARYGHVAGYAEALETLREASQGQSEPPALLSTHPNIDRRIAAMDRLAEEQGWTVGTTEPLDAAAW